ncbi:MAG: amino acid adenylation domain-containing protein [Nocardioides sp.]|nr:amino acid adenylation domain-containing protein [Nocardioides sp.]
MRANPFEHEDASYLVLRNPMGQRSLWPIVLDVPDGWTVDLPASPRADALSHVKHTWTDMLDADVQGAGLPTLAELFQESADAHGDLIAVESDDEAVTYDELAARVNRLARLMIAHGVGPGELVGVSLQRGITQTTVALAVSASGAAYVPLDPAYPAERIEHIITDSAVRTVVHAGSLPDVVDPADAIDVGSERVSRELATYALDAVTDSDRRSPLRPGHLMYVIYTSGSTGTPKGTAVSHAGIQQLVETQRSWIGAGPGDRVLQWASFNFDAGFWDMTLALLSGATLVLTDDRAVLPGEELHRTLVDRRVSHATLPPVALSITEPDGVLLDGVLLSTGDTCPSSLVDAWARGRRMFNGYGPTEMTVGVCMAGPLQPGEQVSIGVPWRGNDVRVLDERLAPCPHGVEGELYLVGAGEALGYLNRPDLTAQRFVADPYGAPGTRMYRSGDLGHRAKDGQLHFSGRADRQVKLRGFRVELGEVEAVLDSCPEVSLSAVVVRGELDSAQLVAFVACSGAGNPVSPDSALTEWLADRLRLRLPGHMVPAEIVVVDALPMTTNGKIDRRELQSRAALAADAGAARPSRGATPVPEHDRDPEAALCVLAAEVLGVPVVEPHDDFFRRGGHSVLAVKLVRRVRDEWGGDLSVRAVFERPTMAELSRLLGPADPAASLR